MMNESIVFASLWNMEKMMKMVKNEYSRVNLNQMVLTQNLT